MFGSVCWVGHFFFKFDRGKLGKIVKKKNQKKHTHTGHTVLRLSIQKDHTKTKNKKTNANYMKQSYTPSETLL